MNPRHAAAIALVGWYLLAPPIVRDPGRWHPNTTAPLNEWSVAKSFDSVAECEKRLEEEKAQAENPQSVATAVKQLKGLGGGAAWHADDFRALIINQQCVASDDPRLKPK